MQFLCTSGQFHKKLSLRDAFLSRVANETPTFFLSKIQSTVCFLSGVYKRLLLKFWQKRESHRLLMMIYKNCSKFFPLKKCLVASFLFLLYNPTPKSKIYTAISINGVFENQKYKLLITFYVASQTRL